MTTSPIVVDNHILWPDGSISVDPTDLIEYVYKLGNVDQLRSLYVTELTPEIVEYNNFSEHKFSVKESFSIPDKEWRLPEHYKYLDLDEYLIELFDRIEKDELYDKRLQRLSEEIVLFKQLDLYDVLRTLIYVIDTMKEQKVVWGVGRGSSCSSYLLFLLGLHEVDPVKYDIEITDFLKVTGD